MMSDPPTAETQASEDDAFVAEALRRFDERWLPARLDDNNAVLLANAWRDCDNVLSKFARGDPITSDFLAFRLDIWTQQDRLKDWGRRLRLPHILDPNDDGPLDPRLGIPRLVQGAFDFLDDIVKSVAPLVPLSRKHKRPDFGYYLGPPSMSLRIISATRWHGKDKRTLVSLHRGLRECINCLFELLADADASILSSPFPGTAGPVLGASSAEQVADAPIAEESREDQVSETRAEPDDAEKSYRENSAANSGIQKTHFRNFTAKDEDSLEDHKSVAEQPDDQKDHLREMLRITVVGFKYPANATLEWEVIKGRKARERHQEMEYVDPIHSSWSLMYASDLTKNNIGTMQPDYRKRDSEASRKFEGIWPSARTIEGFAADFNDWASKHQSNIEGNVIQTSTGDVPNHSLGQLIEWLDELQQRKALPENRMEQSTFVHMQKLGLPLPKPLMNPMWPPLMAPFQDAPWVMVLDSRKLHVFQRQGPP
ncbi:hypothetical protein ACJZ2D_009732 [Fusarium nematophilum]